jgi:hypothetical protein
MDLQALNRLPKKQLAAFKAHLLDFQTAVANGRIIAANRERCHPPGDTEAGEVFATLLYYWADRRENEFWPAWERWAGAYAVKSWAEQSRQRSFLFFKGLLIVFLVIVAFLGYGAWTGSFEGMSWLPLAGGAWLTFVLLAVFYSVTDWLRFRGSEWPVTPGEAIEWRRATPPVDYLSLRR